MTHKDTASIKLEGYIVELADGGPWLRNDLTWTPEYAERGVWPNPSEAEAAIVCSLNPDHAIEQINLRQ